MRGGIDGVHAHREVDLRRRRDPCSLGMPMRAVGIPRPRRMLASVAPLVPRAPSYGRPSTASQPRPQDWMTQLSGGVLVPGIDSVMSHDTSSSGCRRRIPSIASANCRRTSLGVVRGLTRTSTSRMHAAGESDAVRAQPPSMWPMLAWGATRPEVLRVGVLGKPGLQPLDQRGGVDDRVLEGDPVSAPDVGVPAVDHQAEPAQPDLLPVDRPAGLGDDGEVGVRALLEHERAAIALAGVVAASWSGSCAGWSASRLRRARRSGRRAAVPRRGRPLRRRPRCTLHDPSGSTHRARRPTSPGTTPRRACPPAARGRPTGSPRRRRRP